MPNRITDTLGFTAPDLDEVADGPTAFTTLANQVENSRIYLLHNHLWSGVQPTITTLNPGQSGAVGTFGQGFPATCDGWAEFEFDVFVGGPSATVFTAGLCRIGMAETAAAATVAATREQRYHNHAKTAGMTIHFTAISRISRGMTTMYAVPRISADPTSSQVSIYEISCRLSIFVHQAIS